MAGLPNTQYVLPTAESIPVSMNMGMRMPSWFDLFGLSPAAPEDVVGIERAIQRVNTIIDGEGQNTLPHASLQRCIATKAPTF
jgi:phospholipase/carboxylesterase